MHARLVLEINPVVFYIFQLHRPVIDAGDGRAELARRQIHYIMELAKVRLSASVPGRNTSDPIGPRHAMGHAPAEHIELLLIGGRDSRRKNEESKKSRPGRVRKSHQ